MKKTAKKLRLQHETVKRLATAQLVDVIGGSFTVPTVFNTHCNSCRGDCESDPPG